MRKSTNRGNGVIKKIKRGVVGFGILLIAFTTFLNSSIVTGNQKDVYSGLRDKYGYNDVAENASETEVTNESQEEVKEEVVLPEGVKNYTLTVDMDLRTKSNVSAEEIDKMLEGTKMHGLGSAFVKAEQTYGVNALYLMGLACLESAYGSSNYAVNRNNLYGWAAYDSNPDNAKYFESKESATMFVAERLKRNYLTEGGTWFEGYSAKAVDVHYCTDKQHAYKIVNIVSNLTKKLV